MKAYTVSDYCGEYGTMIVFAETAGKARQAALQFGDTFEDCEWNDLRVNRFKEYDQYYNGEAVPDFWHDEEHLIRLVRDYGWSCIEPIDECCKECPAKEWCSHFQPEIWEVD